MSDFKSSTEFPWFPNSYVKIEKQGPSSIKLTANREGLLSLAEHLKLIANGEDKSAYYDQEPGDLEAGSLNMEIIKLQCNGR